MRLSTIITTLISLTSTLAAAAPVVDEPALALRRPPDEPGYEQYVFPIFIFESPSPLTNAGHTHTYIRTKKNTHPSTFAVYTQVLYKSTCRVLTNSTSAN